PAFMAELRKRSEMAALALELVILTAVRTDEAREAPWGEFDFLRKVWTIPAERMKGGKEHPVPLSPAALNVLEPAAKLGMNEYVFPGPTAAVLYDKAMRETLNNMGQDVTVHGFRSTFKDWTRKHTNFPREWAEVCLAHTVGNSTERAYARDDLLDERRR